MLEQTSTKQRPAAKILVSAGKSTLLLQFFMLAFVASNLYAQSKSAKPLKVFILAGQSNMQGHARVETIKYLKRDSDSRHLIRDLLRKNGAGRIHENTWINYLSNHGIKMGQMTIGFGADENKIGPELMFAVRMQSELREPILIIKTAWGGKSLHTDFRPPSASAFRFSDQQLKRFSKQGKDIAKLRDEKKQACGKYYRDMIGHVKAVLDDIGSTYIKYDPRAGFELSGFVWFQGWNDMVDSGVYPKRNESDGYAAYSELLGHFIRDVRKDLNAPELPFVIGVMGVGGPTKQYGQHQKRNQKPHQHFRDAMAATANMPEFRGNVANVFTENYWDQDLGELKSRESRITQQVRRARKTENWNQREARRQKEVLMAEQFSAQEIAALKEGVSNQEYHYLGSAKIMLGIGQGFAEAMLGLQKKQPGRK